MDRKLLVWLLLHAVLGSSHPQGPPTATPFLEGPYPTDNNGDPYYEDPEYKKAFESKEEDIFQLILYNKTARGEWVESIYYFPVSENINHHSGLPEGLQSLQAVSCLVFNHHEFRCSWRTQTTPSEAVVSFSVLQLEEGSRHWGCTASHSHLLECSGRINPERSIMTIQVNVSLPHVRYLYSQHFEVKQIEKLSPPHNISLSLIDGNLQIEWNFPEKIQKRCLHYQLRLDNGTSLINITAERKHTEQNADVSRKHSVQIRVTKKNSCRINGIWSDWSQVVVLDAAVELQGVSVLAMTGIGFGIPMILLTFLLLCRFHRIHEKMFPPIPGPSKNTKLILEREDLFQDTKTKYTEEAESVTIMECVKVLK